MDEQPLENLPAFLEACIQGVIGDSISNILEHLRSETIPSAHSGTDVDIEMVKRAIGSLRILRSFMVTSSHSNEPGVTPVLVHAAWRDIWRWIVFLHTRCIIHKSYGATIMHASMHTIPYTLKGFGWHAGLRASMIQTPGLISMLSRYWLEEETFIKQPELAWNERHFALALEHMLTYGTDGQNGTDREVVTAITRCAEGGAATIVRVALQQFGSMLLSKIYDFDPISLLLTLIDELSRSYPVLRPSLLSQGLIPTLVHFLRDIPPFSDNGEIPPELDRCIIMAAVILIMFIQTMNGPSFIVQALKSGLLDAFVTSWPWIQRKSSGLASTMSTNLFAILQDYFVYRSVLRSLAKPLEMAERMGKLAPDCKPWMAFQEAASRRLRFKDQFDTQSEFRLDPGFFGCANHDCHLRSDNIDYKVCSGCYCDSYCSPECQRADWPKHRTVCKSWQKSLRDGSGIPISQHDRHFLHYIATCDFYNNILALKADIRKRYPSNPVSSLYVQMTYVGWPLLEVLPVAELEWRDEDEKSEMETLLHRVQAAEGRQILAQVAVRGGYRPEALSATLRTFPLLLILPPNWLED